MLSCECSRQKVLLKTSMQIEWNKGNGNLEWVTRTVFEIV